ncbi:glycoside hydrolase family 9 protein [Rhizomicrobium electricum]|uniref:glycoside hydrolase family 9 protein n=1 Tax=Rhizomicrobium electricum TaxID=480070 RepID=UPI00141F3C4E|nr:glycoside hydrolase family 9 protein [Rhizomicrobium electricum]NIJ50271.1 endoglucanase [Rhizomicrobium electricum]
MSATRREVLGGLTAAAVIGKASGADVSNPIIALPKTNQIGFLPQDAKHFVWTVEELQSPHAAFAIHRADESLVFRGFTAAPADQRASAGEFVTVGDFSQLRAPGTYRVVVNGVSSHPFVIGETVYRPLLRDAVRAFRLIRANTAIDDPVTKVHHAAGHLRDGALPVDGVTRDLSGGWYNAGDFGKWVHMAALSVSHMMWLYELRPQAAFALKLDVPSTPGLPDLLAEARWGLDFMLRMQNADGSVLHKVDAEPNLPWGVLPADDTTERHAMPAGSWDVAVFVGAMVQAAGVFKPFDPAFAERCRAAALKAWTWLQAHPAVENNDPYYAGSDIAPKWLWALGAMASWDSSLLSRAAQEFDARGVVPSSWMTPQILGALTLARGPAGKARDVAIAKIAAAADTVMAQSATDAYGCNGDPAMYFWGGVENALNAANTCFMAHALGAGAKYPDGGTRVLDYVLGHNALGRAFVTGHGTVRVEHPWHWIYRDQAIAIPGWAVGGPNHATQGADQPLKILIASGTPAAKCYLDQCDSGSWASNEGQTSENAALLFAVGMRAA